MAHRLPTDARATQFGNIILGGKNQHREENLGILRMHTGGFGWKSKKSGQVIAISKSDLKQVEWLKIPHAYQLKLRIKGGFVYMFNGLKNQACPPDIAPPPIAAAPARPLLARVRRWDVVRPPSPPSYPPPRP